MFRTFSSRPSVRHVSVAVPVCPPPAGGDDNNDHNQRPPIDTRPARRALAELVAWCAAVATAHAPEPEDADAIERVERYATALIEGVGPCCLAALRPDQLDLVVTASALIDAFAIDFKIPGLAGLFGAVYAAANEIGQAARDGEAHGARLGALVREVTAWVPRRVSITYGGIG